jgi:hypothetical protein
MTLVLLWLIFLPAAIVVEAVIMPDWCPYVWMGTIFVAIVVSRGNRSAE